MQASFQRVIEPTSICNTSSRTAAGRAPACWTATSSSASCQQIHMHSQDIVDHLDRGQQALEPSCRSRAERALATGLPVTAEAWSGKAEGSRPPTDAPSPLSPPADPSTLPHSQWQGQPLEHVGGKRRTPGAVTHHPVARPPLLLCLCSLNTCSAQCDALA